MSVRAAAALSPRPAWRAQEIRLHQPRKGSCPPTWPMPRPGVAGASRTIRGNDVAMVFQRADELGCRRGLQRSATRMAEVIWLLPGQEPALRRPTLEAEEFCQEQVGHPRSSARGSCCASTPHNLSPRAAAAGDDRHGPGLPAGLLIADEPTTALDVTIRGSLIMRALLVAAARLPRPGGAAHHPRPRRRRGLLLAGDIVMYMGRIVEVRSGGAHLRGAGPPLHPGKLPCEASPSRGSRRQGAPFSGRSGEYAVPDPTAECRRGAQLRPPVRSVRGGPLRPPCSRSPRWPSATATGHRCYRHRRGRSLMSDPDLILKVREAEDPLPRSSRG